MMSVFSFELLERPTDAQIEQVITIFVDLMKDAPAALTFSGGDRTLFPLRCAAAVRSSLISGGELYVAFTTRREIAAFALWMPPGVRNSPEGNKILEEYMGKLPPERQIYYTDMLTAVAGLVVNILGSTAALDNWLCTLAMTRREYQGQGTMSALFRIVFDKATVAKHRIRLSTTIDGNIPIYQALGLTLRGSVQIESPLEPAFSFHLFSRDP